MFVNCGYLQHGGHDQLVATSSGCVMGVVYGDVCTLLQGNATLHLFPQFRELEDMDG